MRFLLSAVCFWTIVFGAGAVVPAEHAPREIAGYRLGTPVSVYGDRLNSENTFTVRLRPYLKEAPVSVPEGFDSGYVVYGQCDAPGTILRIKVKYEDDRRAFFDRLLDALKKKYGAPKEYVGDPFQAYVAWKWTFGASGNEKITMIVSHYDGDDEEHTQGNALKLTLTSQIAKESQCYEAQRQKQALKERPETARGAAKRAIPEGDLWGRFLPVP